MPTVNQAQIPYTGTSGSGVFVGSEGPTITMTKTNNTNIGTGGTFTTNGNCGTLTTGSLSLAINTKASYTWNNTFFVSGAQNSVCILNGKNTGTSTVYPVQFDIVIGSGTATLGVYNFGLTAFNGTVSFIYLIL